jgi:predicted amidophosphoribosyltransferase
MLSPPSADLVRAAVAYDRLARRFLLRIKLGRRRELLGPIADRLLLTVRASGIASGCAIIAPVPSDRLTDLRRGFSPSRELSRRLARRLGIGHRGFLVSRRLLRGRALKRLGPEMRKKGAKEAFFVRNRLAGETVLLVDDVMTTGASIEACAEALKRAGAKKVRAAIWARAMRSNY